MAEHDHDAFLTDNPIFENAVATYQTGIKPFTAINTRTGVIWQIQADSPTGPIGYTLVPGTFIPQYFFPYNPSAPAPSDETAKAKNIDEFAKQVEDRVRGTLSGKSQLERLILYRQLYAEGIRMHSLESDIRKELKKAWDEIKDS